MRRALSAFLLSVVACGTLHAAEYAIQLTRPVTIGTRYDLDTLAVIEESGTIKTGEESQESESNVTLRFHATGEVFDVDNKGREIRTIYSIRSCTRTTGGETAELLPEGTLLTVWTEHGDLRFQLPDGEVAGNATDVLGLLVPVFKGGRDDDEVFGTRRPQRPGSSWPVNKEAAVADLKAKRFFTEPRHLQGNSRLVGITNTNNIDCLKIVSEVSIRQLTVPLPDSLRVETGTVRAEITGLYPLDPRKGRLQEINRVTLSMQIKGNSPGQGAETTIDSTMNRTVTRSFRFH
ncbi:MAG TPA: hypothetical protein VMS21_14335 [Methylomirabilota bacterium]|nr:hypothetical protein [Methylomirabilota bacterium]